MAPRRPAVKPLRTTVLIMAFDTPKEYAAAPSERRGWWFGSHSVHRNPNAGELFAEALTSAIRVRLDWVNLFDRLKLRKYFAKKRSILKSEFKDLDNDGIDELMGKISPLEFARELGADKVLTGKIVQSETFFQRVINYWSSRVEVECSLIDAGSGKTLWSARETKKGRLDSQKAVMEAVARRLVDRMEKEYFFSAAAQ